MPNEVLKRKPEFVGSHTKIRLDLLLGIAKPLKRKRQLYLIQRTTTRIRSNTILPRDRVVV